jgi:hypothetical protein
MPLERSKVTPETGELNAENPTALVIALFRFDRATGDSSVKWAPCGHRYGRRAAIVTGAVMRIDSANAVSRHIVSPLVLIEFFGILT